MKDSTQSNSIAHSEPLIRQIVHMVQHRHLPPSPLLHLICSAPFEDPNKCQHDYLIAS